MRLDTHTFVRECARMCVYTRASEHTSLRACICARVRGCVHSHLRECAWAVSVPASSSSQKPSVGLACTPLGRFCSYLNSGASLSAAINFAI
jgi:hypothetical protein